MERVYNQGKLLSEVIREINARGNVVKISRMNEGVLHGVCVELHDNGSLKKECEYQRGKLHGRFTTFNENGGVENLREYRNGNIVNVRVVNGITLDQKH